MAAEQFSVNMKRPDKEEAIRIEALPDGAQGGAPSEKNVDKTASNGKARDARPRQNDKPRYEREGPPKFGKKPGFDKKPRHEHKPAYAGQPRREDATPFAKPAFGKKPKKNKYRG